jgi:iron(III) transport system permease protein
MNATAARPAFGRDPAVTAAVIVLWLLLALFVVYPLAMLFVRIVVDKGALDLSGIVKILTDRHQVRAFWNSLLLAFLVGIAGTLIGFLFAFTAARTRLPRAALTLLDASVLLPLVSPPFTTAIAMIFSFGPRGLITYDLLGIKGVTVYGLTSTLCSEVLTYFPIAYLTLRPILAAIDSNVEGMAFSLGASRWRVFRTVTLPLAVPGLANAFLLLFAASLADFATPLILGGNQFPVLPTQAFLQITGMFDLRGGAALSLVLLVPAMIVFLLQRYWVSRRYYVTITGKGAGQTPFDSVSPWVRRALLTACVATVVVVVYFYALLFYASIVVAFGANHALTLQHYRVIFTEGPEGDPRHADHRRLRDAARRPLRRPARIPRHQEAVRRSADDGGRVDGQLRAPRHDRRHRVPDRVQRPADRVDRHRTGDHRLLRLSLRAHRHPRDGRVALADRPQHRGSFAGSWRGSGTTFRRVTLPLIMPAFFAGLGVVFIRSMTAISATIFLVSISWTLITVKILENMTELALGPAAAFSVLVVAIVFVVIGAVGWLLRSFRAPGAARVTSLLGG